VVYRNRIFLSQIDTWRGEFPIDIKGKFMILYYQLKKEKASVEQAISFHLTPLHTMVGVRGWD